MRISIIVAMSENRVIGRRGQLPWRLSSDLRRFKRLTMGHHIVMGRKTFESIGRLLPGRTSIVLTRQPDYALPGGLIARDLDQAVCLAEGDEEIFLIGGGEVYRQALQSADRIYLTLIHATVEGDTFFPPTIESDWRSVEHSRHAADAKNEFEHSFLIYDRVESS